MMDHIFVHKIAFKSYWQEHKKAHITSEYELFLH